jgi:predicted ArsR family transcriptional regulator
VTDDLASRLSGIGALAEPVRRDLYLYVVRQPQPVSRDQAAADTGLRRHAVKFHLDRLVDEGLLDVEYRRLSGRQGPGAGRPSKLYRRTDREVSVSLPERRYELVGRVFADAIRHATEGTPIADAVARAATDAGRRLVATTGPAPVMEVLRSCGFEPRVSGDRVILVNCPFHALAAEHTALVCGVNLDFLRAITAELAPDTVDVRLDPGPGRCCVTLQPPPAVN